MVWGVWIQQFIIWTNVAWMVGVTYMSLDLAMDLTGYHHQGHSAGLFFLTIIFPGIAVMLYAILVIVVVYQQLDRHWVLSRCPSIVRCFYDPSNGGLPLNDVLSDSKLWLRLHPEYVYMALFTFAVSQVTLFVASSKIAQSTHGHVNGSMFSSLLDMLSFFLVYRFWHKITDGTGQFFHSTLLPQRLGMVIADHTSPVFLTTRKTLGAIAQSEFRCEPNNFPRPCCTIIRNKLDMLPRPTLFPVDSL